MDIGSLLTKDMHGSRTNLMPIKPLNKRIILNIWKTLKAGMRRDIGVNQFFLRKLTLPGAKMNLIRKAMIKITQMVRLKEKILKL